MDLPSFIQQFADILAVPASGISAETDFRSLPEWDSLSVVSYIALVDESFHITVAPRQIAGCRTVADLYRLASTPAES